MTNGQENARERPESRLANVEFRHAPIERLPLDDCIWLIARKEWTGRAAEA